MSWTQLIFIGNFIEMESIQLFYHYEASTAGNPNIHSSGQIYLDPYVLTFPPSLISQQNNEKSKHISMLDKMFVIISVTLTESA